MITKHIAKIAFAFLFLLTMACEPILERDELTNSFTPDDIELEVVQSTTGGNGLSIRMNTPGVTGYWDYNIGIKYTDRVDVVYPIPGTSTFTFHATTAYMPNGDPQEIEYVSKSVDVQIDVLDQPLPQAYYDLVGENLEGKTWEFAGEGGDGSLFWYMCPPNDAAAWNKPWWNAGGTCCPPGDVDGTMTFDLNQGANYTYLATPGATPVTGSSFSFNGDFTKLLISGGANILGKRDVTNAPDGEYQIVSLTADKMILYVPKGWVWVFVPSAP